VHSAAFYTVPKLGTSSWILTTASC